MITLKYDIFYRISRVELYACEYLFLGTFFLFTVGRAIYDVFEMLSSKGNFGCFLQS
jgi:hypothetical protein